MATFIGASPEDLDVLAQTMSRQAGHLAEIDSRVRAQLSQTTWFGGDMERFSATWSTRHAGDLAAVAHSLQRAATAVRAQARQQRVASGAVGSGAGPSGPGGVGSWADAGPGGVNGPGAPGLGDLGEAVPLGLMAMLGLVPGAYNGFKKIYEPLDSLWTVGHDAPEWLQKWRAIGRAKDVFREAERVFEWTGQAENARLNSILRQVDDVNDYRVLRQWYLGQEHVLDAFQDVVKAGGEIGRAENAFVDAVKMTGPLSRAGGLLGVVGGVVQVIHPDHETGVLSVIDRGVGGITAIASGTALAAGVGLITLSPLGAGVVAGALVAGAVWTGGNYVVDHWDSISHGADVAGDWINAQNQKVLDTAAHAVDDVAGAVADGAGDVAHAVGSSATGAWKSVKGLF
ncbi:hypothetical protein ACIB24_20955 [Spongisporangium articulatum]|uniref:WXG100 family type VII secretion target n=1 Tax=Spongisporangium articulatum TaxID=3362603 RepID=A0ABW8AT18_9ACTN